MMKSITLAIVVALSAPMLTGCVAVAGAAVGAAAAYGVIQYTANGAYRSYSADLEQTWEATVAALRDLGYPVDPAIQHGPSSGHIEIRDVVVELEAEGEDVTRVLAKIGTFETEEHKRRAEAILERISERLSG